MAQPLIKFFRASAAPTTGLAQGAIWFNPSNNEIRVYNGTEWEKYSGLVKNVEYAEATKILTITPFEGVATSINLEEFVKGYINALDVTDTAVAGEYVSKVDQVDGLISVTRAKLPVVDVTAPDGTTIVNSESKKAELSQVTATTINAAEANCSDNKFATEKAVRSAINALDYTDTAVAGQYVSAVSEVDGVITVTRADLPTESADVDSLDGKTGVITTLKGQTATGSINLEVDENNQLKATLVGSFENGAQVNKLEGVKLNGAALTIAEDKTVNVTAIEGIVENDKVLSKSGNNIMSTLSLDYETQGEGDAAKKYIVLKGINGVEIDKIDASDFIADSFLDDVEIKKEDGKDILYFTWAMADGTTKTDSVDLSKYINIYTGAENQIVVSESNVIGLAEHKAEAATGKALTPAHGGSFNVITGVTTDDYGRVNSVETSQVTLPTIADGDKTGSDDYVSVQVKTAAGVVSEVIVNTDALSTKIEAIEGEVSENAQVTAAALTDLNSRLTAAEDTLASGVGVMAVEGEDPYKFASLPAEDQALVQAHDDFVWTEATTDAEGKVTLDTQVVVMKSTEPAKGLATDAYVNERIAAEKVTVSSKTLDVTHDGNNYNVELAWQMF